MIRTLIDIGGLSTQQARDILTLIDDPHVPMVSVVAAAHGALARHGDDNATKTELALVDDYIRRRGWRIHPHSPTRVELAGLLATMQLLQRAGPEQPLDVDACLDPYADAVESIVADEVASIPDGVPRDVVIEHIVLGTVLAERTLGSLRRLAQESRYLGSKTELSYGIGNARYRRGNAVDRE